MLPDGHNPDAESGGRKHTWLPLAVTAGVLGVAVSVCLMLQARERSIMERAMAALAAGLPLALLLGGLVYLGQTRRARVRRDARNSRKVQEALARRAWTDGELQRINRAAKAISDCNRALIRLTGEQQLFQELCRILVETGGYRMAWVGAALHDEARTVAPLAQAGFEEGYLPTLKITWADNQERGLGPTARAIRTRQPWVVENILTEPDYAPWREEALKRGYASAAAIPLVFDSDNIGSLNVYSAQPGAFQIEEMKLLADLADNLVYGVRALRVADEQKRAVQALHESEQRYRLLVERAVHGIYRTSADGRILEANPAFAETLGFTREELLQLNIRDLYRDPVERQRLVAKYQHDPRLDRVSGQQIEIQRKDGRFVRLSLSGRALRDAGGALEGFELIAEDLTEKSELEARLFQAQRMEAIGRLAGGVAHDFNNLLTVIKGYSGLLLQEVAAGSAGYRAAEQINRAADRASSLTRQLLAFSRQPVMQPRLLDLNRVIAETQKMLARLIGEDIQLAVKLSECPVLVELDPGHITQVILNLALNARDAMPRGGTLTVETANIESAQPVGDAASLPPGRYALLSVRDTGRGIGQENARRVFEPFFDHKEEGKGTGLGLAAVYGIVKQSGGEICVSSEKDRGTTFTLYFPRAEQGHPNERPEQVCAPPPAAGATILLVEDEARVRELVAALLRRQGHWVLEACDGREALEAAQRAARPIDLLMTDVVMPNMSGPDLAAALSKLCPRTKVIYVSGYTDDAVVRHGLDQRGVPLLQKPFTMEGLRAAVQAILNPEPSAGAA